MLSASQFERVAAQVAVRWPQLSPGSPVSWEIASVESPFGTEVYLRLSSAVPAQVLSCGDRGGSSTRQAHLYPNSSPSGPDHAPGHDQEDRHSGLEDLHLYEEQPPSAPSSEQRLYDMHIVRHPAYQVPTLLLRGSVADGRPLGWEDTVQDFPQWQEHARSAGSDWAFIVPEVHPVLQQPGWLMLHPCQTPEVLRLLLLDEAALSPAGAAQPPCKRLSWDSSPVRQSEGAGPVRQVEGAVTKPAARGGGQDCGPQEKPSGEETSKEEAGGSRGAESLTGQGARAEKELRQGLLGQGCPVGSARYVGLGRGVDGTEGQGKEHSESDRQQQQQEEEEEMEVPDIDAVGGGVVHTSLGQAAEGHSASMQGHAQLPESSSDAELWRYAEAWLRLVAPVAGLHLPARPLDA